MIAIEKVTVQQIDKIAALAKLIWNQHYIDIIGKNQVEYMLDKFYSLQSIKQQMDELQEFYFIKDDDVILGFFSFTIKPENEIFIHKFYIDAHEQAKGVGTKVLRILKNKLGRSKKYILTVNRQNYKSINFYFKNGFIIEQVADFDIGNGYVMNDFVMVYHDKLSDKS